MVDFVPSRYVAGISWPRSGHHLLQRLLQSYFPTLLYCDFYGAETDCCRQVPCSRPKVTFSKSHDFDNEVIPQPGTPYLIQFRKFSPSVVSDWELVIRDGRPDNFASFREFAFHKAIYWAAFAAKWIDPPAQDLERCVVYYEDLTTQPVSEIEKVVRFFSPDLEANHSRIVDVVSNVAAQNVTKEGEVWLQEAGIENRRNLEEFRHYDRDFFALITQEAENLRLLKSNK